VVPTQQNKDLIADLLPILVVAHVWFDLRGVNQAHKRQNNVDAHLKISVPR